MQGPSHVGFALASSMSINSGIYFLFPHALPNDWEYTLHALGKPYAYTAILDVFHHPLLGTTDVITTFIHKVLFYLLLIWSARLPDKMEKREGEDAENIKHRGATHSLFALFVISLLYFLVYAMLIQYYHQYHTSYALPIIQCLTPLGLGVFIGFITHIFADMLTTRGVKVLWPDETSYGLLPRSMRFSNKTWGEYLVLWGFIFITGMFFALGIVGL